MLCPHMNLSLVEWLGVTLLRKLNCLGWIRVNLLWLNYHPWIDSSWITLVWFDPIELDLPSLVHTSMFNILGLGVFDGSFEWFFIMVVHTFDGDSLGKHE